jgi:hypothetical protein
MLLLEHQMLLRAGSAAVGAAALAPTAPARAPQLDKQAQPGFYRFKLGAIESPVVGDKRDGDKRNFVEDMQTRADIYDPIGLKDFETLDASIVATVLPVTPQWVERPPDRSTCPTFASEKSIPESDR